MVKLSIVERWIRVLCVCFKRTLRTAKPLLLMQAIVSTNYVPTASGESLHARIVSGRRGLVQPQSEHVLHAPHSIFFQHILVQVLIFHFPKKHFLVGLEKSPKISKNIKKSPQKNMFFSRFSESQYEIFLHES